MHDNDEFKKKTFIANILFNIFGSTSLAMGVLALMLLVRFFRISTLIIALIFLAAGIIIFKVKTHFMINVEYSLRQKIDKESKKSIDNAAEDCAAENYILDDYTVDDIREIISL